MAEPILYRRFARQPLEEALEDTPVVLIHGPRQSGKTTLARMVGDAAGYEYIIFFYLKNLKFDTDGAGIKRGTKRGLGVTHSW